MAKIRVTLVKSTIGQVAAVKGTVAALGLLYSQRHRSRLHLLQA